MAFLQIWTSTIRPTLRCFAHFDLEMCFAPQRRAIFPDRIFQNARATLNFSTFWLTNVLRATAAWRFYRSELPKFVPSWGVLRIFTYKCASRRSGVPFFISVLNSYLRTHRFGEPTFWTSGTTNHWKNTAFCHIPSICRVSSFFLLTRLARRSSFYRLDYLLVELLSTDLTSFDWLDHSSTLLFNCPHCRKLDF